MSSSERSKRTSHLPSWRSNEPPEAPPEGLRVRGPIVRPSDFVQENPPSPAEDRVDAVEEAIRAREQARREIDRRIEASMPPPASETVVSAPAAAVPPAATASAAAPAAAPAVVAPAVVTPAASVPDHIEPQPSPRPAGDAPILDLRSAVRSIWAKKLVVLALAVAGAVLGAATIPLLPQKFTAETSLYFDPRQAGGSDSGQSSTAPELITTMIDSQTQILSSGKVLGRVVEALKLDQDPQFNGGASGEAAKYVAAAVLQKAVQIAREASTYVVSLKVTTRDPQQSARIANQLVASFIEEESKAAANSYKTASTALDSRLEDLRQQVLAAEKAVESYRADNDMVAVEGNLISDKRLTALNDMLVTAQQRTIEAKARADAAGKLSFEDVVSSARSNDATTTSNALSNLRQQYAVQAANVGSMQSQLGARHPRLLAARSSLDSLAGEIRSELQRQATSARADYEQAQKAEQDIGKELAVQKASQVNTSGKLVELNELQRKAAAAREVYEALLKRSGQTSDAQDLSQSNIRVISEAQPPLTADGPSRKIMMVAGLIAGALFGMALGMALAILLGLFRHPVIRSYIGK